MAPEKSEKVRLALEKVWLNSRPEALERVATLQRFAEDLRLGIPDQQSRQNALSAAHRLSGSLGMFGLNEASCCATKLEALLEDNPMPDRVATLALVARLRMLLEGIQPCSETPDKRRS